MRAFAGPKRNATIRACSHEAARTRRPRTPPSTSGRAAACPSVTLQDWCAFDHPRVRGAPTKSSTASSSCSVGHVRLPFYADVTPATDSVCRSVTGSSRLIARGSRSARTTARPISMPISRVPAVTAITRRTRIRGVWLPAALKAILEPFPGCRQVPGRALSIRPRFPRFLCPRTRAVERRSSRGARVRRSLRNASADARGGVANDR